MPEVTIGDLRIAYERAGDGPPLVLLHGGFGFDSRSWRRQLDALSDAFTVVAWDMPGCGRSVDPPETFRASDFADCLAAFIGALGLERPHVLGLSFGSALALELYRSYPSLPRSLILASAYAGWASSLPPDAVEARKQRVLRALVLPPEQWAREWSPSMLSAAPAALVDEVVAALAADYTTLCDSPLCELPGVITLARTTYSRRFFPTASALRALLDRAYANALEEISSIDERRMRQVATY